MRPCLKKNCPEHRNQIGYVNRKKLMLSALTRHEVANWVPEMAVRKPKAVLHCYVFPASFLVGEKGSKAIAYFQSCSMIIP